MRKLPSLNGVKAFEAAARHGSFAAAAAELNVTPAAVSRLVKLLEERLGIALFERKANGLSLTAAGSEYQNGLTPLLDNLATLTSQIESLSGPRILTIGVGPTFATRWLIPRLSDFQKTAPDIEIRFTTGGAAGSFSDDWTCGIQQGDGNFEGLVSEPMFSADLTPVCAPRLATELDNPSDLKPAQMLRVTHAPEDWRQWLHAAGLARVSARGAEFDYYAQALQAAIDGVGVALGIRPYVDDDLAAGRLVAPFSVDVSNGKQWYLVYRENHRRDREFTVFRDWVMGQTSR
ncbi:MAG: LysR substrate-binding domain-containing protein [Hyphomicrobiaceae bacterium]